MTEYKHIIRALLCGEGEDLIRDGTAHSFPLPTRDDDGSITDNFFLYGVSFPSGEAAPPNAHLGIRADSGKLVFHRTGDFPGASLEAPVLSYEKFMELSRRYEALYPAVRSFAYSNFLKTTQLDTLVEFCNTQRVLFDAQLPWYRHMAPGFYDWMIRMTAPHASFMEQCSTGEASLAELEQFLAMASDDPGRQQTVLGLDDAEFAAWKAQGDAVLRTILFSRMMGENFAEYDSWPAARKLAARSYDPDALEDIRHDDT